jgi:hypothetical protein
VFLAKLRWQHNLSKSREFGVWGRMGTRAKGKKVHEERKRDVEGKEGGEKKKKKEKEKRKEYC